MKLRDYQQDGAINGLYEWFSLNKKGNPVVNLPGGSGKSVVIGAFIEGASKKWPQLRFLMLVHSKELVEQNAEKLLKIWPNAPLGIYSASLNSTEIDAITYAGIGSVAKKSALLGHIDICIVDECHAISNDDQGQYRQLLSELSDINPKMRVIGFSASPYRTGQGMVTDGDLFDDILEPVSIQELVDKGHLAPLRSKVTAHSLSTDGIKKHKGDYQAKAMQTAFNTETLNEGIISEAMEVAIDRKHWLIFCSGVDHARDMSEQLNAAGVPADYLTGKDPKKEREAKLEAFQNGEIRALCNVNILTTGYDFPALDCIIFARATTSPGLYLQMAVRGMRTSPGKKDCLVLDFCGNVSKHGPVTRIQPPGKKGKGEAMMKPCPECHEILHASIMICDCCGYEFPKTEKTYKLNSDCIMGANDPYDFKVRSWRWSKHTSKKNGVEMIKVSYYGCLSQEPVTEYFFPNHGGYTTTKSMAALSVIVEDSLNKSMEIGAQLNIERFCTYINNNGKPPLSINVIKNGKFYDIKKRNFKEVEHA